MVKSYCIKEKKITDCVKNSERYEKSKNGRLMLNVNVLVVVLLNQRL